MAGPAVGVPAAAGLPQPKGCTPADISKRPRHIALFAIFLTTVLAARARADPSTWQGASIPAPANPQIRNPQSQWLVLDTGGSGGGFGHGDVRQHLYDAFFWDRNVGWACGAMGVFKTEDSGLTWSRARTAPKRGEGWPAYYHVEMAGPQDIWLMEGKHPGGPGKAWLWHSTDNGKTWHEELQGKLAGYRDLYCRGADRWVLCGDFPDYRSADGGKTWQRESFGGLLSGTLKVAIPADVPTAEGFVVYVFGHYQRKQRLIKSENGGATWTIVPLPDGLPDPFWQSSLFYATSRMGWIGLPQGRVLFTEDGGRTWEHRDLPGSNRQVTALWFDQLGRGFAASWNDFLHDQGTPRMGVTLYETAGRGNTWTPALSGKKHVNAIFGRGPKSVWAVGNVPGFVPNDLVSIFRGATTQESEEQR